MTAPDCTTCPIVRSLATARGLTLAQVRVVMFPEGSAPSETHATGPRANERPLVGKGARTQDGQDDDDDGRGWE